MSYHAYIMAKYDISDCKTLEDVKGKFPNTRPAFLRKVIYLKGLRITKEGKLSGTPKESRREHRKTQAQELRKQRPIINARTRKPEQPAKLHASESFISKVQLKLREILAEKVLKQCYPTFKSGRRVYIMIDTPTRDSVFFEHQILDIVNSYLGNPYTIDFAKIGGGRTFVQRLLPLIFLKSNFSLDLLKKARHREQIRILRIWAEGKSIPLSRISQKFLECRKCSDSEKKKIGLDHDLSIEEDAIKFFKECVELYAKLFRRDAVFFFRNLRLNKRMMGSPSTLKFLEKIERELPTALVMIIPKQIEYHLLPVWDKFCYVVIQMVDSEDIEKIVEKICRIPNVQGKLDFSRDGLQQFCREMRRLFGKKIPASVIIRAISDAISYKKLHHLDAINAGVVRNLFSTIKVKIGLPVPRSPTKCKSPYFADEVERLTRECERRGFDPHYVLPYAFRDVLWHIRNGDIKYHRSDDIFTCRRYMEYRHFKSLSRSLYRLGYRYVRGTRSWVFSYT